MRELAFSEAKATLSRVVDDACDGRPTVVTRHGRKVAVVVSFEAWEKATKRPSLWSLLTSAPIDGRELQRSPSSGRRFEF